MYETLYGHEHAAVGRGLHNLGRSVHLQGRVEEAEPLYREAVVVMRASLGDEHPYVGTNLASWARILHEMGEVERAERHFREAIALFRAGPETSRLQGPLHGLGCLLRDTGRPTEGLPLLEEAHAIAASVTGLDHEQTRRVRNDLVACLRSLGRAAAAESLASL